MAEVSFGYFVKIGQCLAVKSILTDRLLCSKNQLQMNLWQMLSEISWRPGIGDPYPLAWATVVSYLVAAYGCALCAVKAPQIFKNQNVAIHRTIWWFMCGTLTFLGINKQLDLQTLFTQVIKVLFSYFNIYQYGPGLQKFFILGLGAVSICGVSWALWKIKREWRRYAVLALGALFIIRFVLVRISLFYDVQIPSLSFLPQKYKLNWALEFIGTVVVAAGAFYNTRARRRNA